MKKVLLTTVAFAAFGIADQASAADLPARTYTKAPAMVAYGWSGFYIGLNGGGASSRECYDLTSVAGTALANTPREGCHNSTGGVVGGQIGYRWQAAKYSASKPRAIGLI